MEGYLSWPHSWPPTFLCAIDLDTLRVSVLYVFTVWKQQQPINVNTGPDMNRKRSKVITIKFTHIKVFCVIPVHGCRQRTSNDFWNENYSSLCKHLLLSLGCLLLRVKHHWTACRTALLLSKHAFSWVAAGVFVKGDSGNLQFFMSWPDSRHTLTIFMIWPYIPSQQDTLEQSFSLSSNKLMYLDNFPLLIVFVLCDLF